MVITSCNRETTHHGVVNDDMSATGRRVVLCIYLVLAFGCEWQNIPACHDAQQPSGDMCCIPVCQKIKQLATQAVLSF